MGPVRPSEFCEHLVEVRIVPSRKTREDIVQAFANETRTGHIKHKINSPSTPDEGSKHNSRSSPGDDELWTRFRLHQIPGRIKHKMEFSCLTVSGSKQQDALPPVIDKEVSEEIPRN